MTITLSSKIERLIKRKVKAGEYESPEAMVQAGIVRLLQDEHEFAPGELRELVQVGLDEMERGEMLDGEKVFADLRRMSRRFRAKRRK
jgi:antitoxin ParD1/3/4